MSHCTAPYSEMNAENVFGFLPNNSLESIWPPSYSGSAESNEGGNVVALYITNSNICHGPY